MARLEDPKMIEATVGVRRHPTKHLARAISDDQRVYLLHSALCLATTDDLRDCQYSRALARGIRLEVWENDQDRAVLVMVDQEKRDLVPGDPSPLISADQVAIAIEDLGRAGVSVRDILTGGLDGTLALAAASGLDLAAAATTAATALEVFNLQTTDTPDDDWDDEGPESIALHSDDELRRMVAAVRSGDQATLDAMVAEANAAAANGDTRG